MAMDLSMKPCFAVDLHKPRGIGRIAKKKTARKHKQITWSLTKTILDYQKLEAEAPKNEHPNRCLDLDDACTEAEATPEEMRCFSAGRQQMAPSSTFDVFPLPEDPRDWSRLDVRTWIMHMKSSFELEDVSADRFPVNGKALCLMTPDMFSSRVPSAGRMLFRDFRLRLAKAMHSKL